ncbi:MAG: glycosyl hydrolase [Candidatus Hydrogenedentota bacterium]|nr:MAG: glycosyl hydrolase [Candidatus Hydrogenedentota bacterium]
MRSSIFLVLGSFFLYSSMTCVHIPLKFPSHTEWNRHLIVNQIKAQSSIQVEEVSKSHTFANTAEKESKQEKEDFFQPEKKQANVEQVVIKHQKPAFTRGIYLTANTAASEKRMESFIRYAKAYNINTFVIDVQPRMIPRKHLEKVLEAGIFPIARVVVFESGLKTLYPSKRHIHGILNLIEDSAMQGFQEVQLDYIRYADSPRMEKISLRKKYAVICSVLQKAREKANEFGIYLSADVFGRITLNYHDHIGQRLELFDKYMDAIYPMVYPSHYTNDPKRISNPYSTVKEGVQNSKERLKRAKVVAYIQGFDMKRKPTGLSMVSYIEHQMQAVEDAKGDGWVIWNPRNQYKPSYQAIYRMERKKLEAKSRAEKPSGES